MKGRGLIGNTGSLWPSLIISAALSGRNHLKRKSLVMESSASWKHNNESIRHKHQRNNILSTFSYTKSVLVPAKRKYKSTLFISPSPYTISIYTPSCKIVLFCCFAFLQFFICINIVFFHYDSISFFLMYIHTH